MSPTSTEGAATVDPESTSTPVDAPSRPVPPAFELPDGCGDGVVVAGQYDCFVPTRLQGPDFSGYPQGDGHDVDGDGREEVVHVASTMRLLGFEDDDGFVLGPEAAPTGVPSDLEWRWDWDGDGENELTVLDVGPTATIKTATPIGAAQLGPWTLVHDLAEPRGANEGKAVPIDVDGDGQLEVVVSRRLEPEWNTSPHEITVRRRAGDAWEFSGPGFPFGGCGWLYRHAYGDVDGDGDEDLVIEDAGTGCDPHPSDYDPAWDRVGVFLVDHAVGELTLAGWFPTGARSNNTWLEVSDADGDGLPDIVMNLTGAAEVSAGFLRGRGDGTFEVGTRLSFEGSGGPGYLNIRARVDLDGDGDREWLGTGSAVANTVAVFALESPMTALSLAALPTIEVPLEGWSHYTESTAVDFNGDGVDDPFVTTNLPGPGNLYRYVFLSAP